MGGAAEYNGSGQRVLRRSRLPESVCPVGDELCDVVTHDGVTAVGDAVGNRCFPVPEDRFDRLSDGAPSDARWDTPSGGFGDEVVDGDRVDIAVAVDPLGGVPGQVREPAGRDQVVQRREFDLAVTVE